MMLGRFFLAAISFLASILGIYVFISGRDSFAEFSKSFADASPISASAEKEIDSVYNHENFIVRRITPTSSFFRNSGFDGRFIAIGQRGFLFFARTVLLLVGKKDNGWVELEVGNFHQTNVGYFDFTDNVRYAVFGNGSKFNTLRQVGSAINTIHVFDIYQGYPRILDLAFADCQTFDSNPVFSNMNASIDDKENLSIFFSYKTSCREIFIDNKRFQISENYLSKSQNITISFDSNLNRFSVHNTTGSGL